jgi:putative two-component system response regulator
MISERGTRFDPIVLDAFLKRLGDIERIRRKYDDQESRERIVRQKADSQPKEL